MFGHDPGIFLGPLLLQFGEFGLANHRIESGAELARDAARAPDPIARDSHRLGQILWWNHQQRHSAQHQQLGRLYVEHPVSSAANAGRGYAAARPVTPPWSAPIRSLRPARPAPRDLRSAR